MIDNRTVGKTIAKLRQSKGMTQQQLAAALNVSHQAVSKWENGAALPDIQTMVDLTHFFGITVEQLLNGDIPEERIENEKPFEEHIQNIGNFFGGVIDDIGNMFKTEPPAAKEDDGAVEAKVANEAENNTEQNVDLESLLQMAPFMSKGAVAEMLEKCKKNLTASDIARFAPYLESSYLEKLIRELEPEITWDTLRRIAPFLKKEAVDALARTIAAGEKAVRPATEELNRAADDMAKTIDDVSKKIGKDMGKARKKVVRIGENIASEVSKVFDNQSEEPLTREERLKKLRRSAFERALEDGKWDWIEAHLSELQDDELKRKISDCASRQGMKEWVYKNLGGFADSDTIENAIAEGNWAWLGEHVWQFEPKMQELVAQSAAKAENWQWLSSHAEQIEMRNCVVDIAALARRSGARMLAVQLTRYDMTPEQVEQMCIEAVGAGDLEFIEMIADQLSQDILCRCCIRLGKAGNWEGVKRLADKLDSKSLEWLMEVAIDAGNFDAIDMLDDMLKLKETEEEPS